MRNQVITSGLLCLVVLIGTGYRPATGQIAPVQTTTVDGGDLVGRWNITMDVNGEPRPSWLEVELSGLKTLVGRFVGTGGSARPISEVNFDNGKFGFAIPPQWESSDRDLVLEGMLSAGTISGKITTSEGKTYDFSGVKAPYLARTAAPKWGEPIELFNGEDLTGWKATGADNQWVVKNGILTSPRSGSNLVSEQTFEDFKLHVEFRYAENSNSGIYLRGRYELQIIDNPKTEHPNSHLFGGIYGFLVPSEMAVSGPNEWQTFDVTLTGRMITVVANGKTIICNQEIPGITGGALNSNEGEPGPIYIQGDHGPIEIRKLVITPASY